MVQEDSAGELRTKDSPVQTFRGNRGYQGISGYVEQRAMEHMQTDWSEWLSGGHKSRAANAGVCTSSCLLLAFIGTGSVPWATRIQIANRRNWNDFKAL